MPGGKYETSSRSGVHTLKISKIELTEGETYEINVGGLEGSCNVTVLEAEKRPVLDWKPKKVSNIYILLFFLEYLYLLNFVESIMNIFFSQNPIFSILFV